MNKSKSSSIRRSAILLLAIGDEDSTAEVLRHIGGDVELVGHEMARLGQVPHSEMKEVLEHFMDEYDQYAAISIQSSDHIRAVLQKALGTERAATLIEDILETAGTSNGFDKMNLMEASVVADMIRDEHPQIITTILVHLERHQAAAVLELFDERLRNDIILRVATFTGVQPAALQELTQVLGSMLDGQNVKRSKMGGVRAAAEILNLIPSAQEDAAVETIRAYREDLAQKILDEMFLFENLLDVDNRGIQLILKEVDTNALVVALKGANPDLLQKFLSNMSQRAAQLLKEDMDARGPIRISEVETQQKAILQIVRRLADNGDIVLGGGEDEYV